jgi:hypothetical protein
MRPLVIKYPGRSIQGNLPGHILKYGKLWEKGGWYDRKKDAESNARAIEAVHESIYRRGRSVTRTKVTIVPFRLPGKPVKVIYALYTRDIKPRKRRS